MASKTHTYRVRFRLNGYWEDSIEIDVIASSAYEAYDKAVYEAIPNKYGTHPYSAWVTSVTYQNGNYKRFNNFDGKPY